MLSADRFRFRPRFRGLAYGAMAIGAAVLALAFGLGLDGSSLTFAAVFGAGGVALGGLYLASPAWRYSALVGDDGLEVLDHRGDRKFLLPWNEVVQVIASPTTETCVVSGGSADRTLIVPGLGAPAPYDIERKRELYAAIMARVPEDRVAEVELVEQFDRLSSD